MGRNCKTFQKGHPGGPGRPRSQDKENRKILKRVMEEARIKRVSKEDLEKAQDAAIALAKSGDFNFFKFIMEREDQYIDVELPKLNSIADVPGIAAAVGEKMLENKIASKKAKEITDVLKQISELNLGSDIERLEDITSRRG